VTGQDPPRAAARSTCAPSRSRRGWIVIGVVAAALALALGGERSSFATAAGPAPRLVTANAPGLGAITVDYPAEGSVFPPEFPPPTFLWRDGSAAAVWTIDMIFSDGAAPIQVRSQGERMKIGEVDPRCFGDTNEPPRLTPEQAAARTWTPDAETWAAIKRRSVERRATVTITGFRDDRTGQAVSRGQVGIRTSKDPVGAPIFYRDVPLMPSELEKGVIKPLSAEAVHYITWRLKDVGQPGSRKLIEGFPTCANCHSFSRDGKTLGVDVDGPQNDKGLYALVDVKPQTSIRNEDVIQWRSFRGKLGGQLRVAFMSQVSPDGRYVVTMINDPGARDDVQGRYYVANFKDYRFLQVFYPTRGILAWYSRETGELQPLPGADDPRYVQACAMWSPDGRYLVFVRAGAKDPYPEGVPMAQYANDPHETQIKYDLYRVPFNGGRGGKAEPVVGASRNGMSNSFPKVSPDGRWIVFVQAKNGLLMRPDSQLYIVPAKGGVARRMRCNTPLMNSWHSFSPNGRWMVFSSKGRSPYTQMYLTHVDEDGNDTPAILVESATAANRAVNIPEFVNIPPDGLMAIDSPATEFYRLFDLALDLSRKNRYEAAIPEWRKALELSPEDNDAKHVHYNLAVALTETGQGDEAMEHLRKVLAIDPNHPQANANLGVALARKGSVDEALPLLEKAAELAPLDVKNLINLAGALTEKGRAPEAVRRCRQALVIDPEYHEAHNTLAVALVATGELDQAIPHFEKALAADPDSAEVHYNLGRVLLTRKRAGDAIPHLEKAARGQEPAMLATLADAYAEAGRLADAVQTGRRALSLPWPPKDRGAADSLRARIASWETSASAGR
jgi:tetratricopeptide (TPR) repeat protein